MSEFSNLFRQFIDEKEIRVYSMVKYCNLDRSTMYKYINGKRNPPSEQIFHKIAEYMQLTPLEYEKFLEAYKISLIGAKDYYRRKSVVEFFLNFPDSHQLSFLSPRKFEAEYNTSLEAHQDCIPLNSQMEINQLLHDILLLEAPKSDGKIALLLQPDYGFLFDILASLPNAVSNARIDHILCLSNTGQISENHEFYNLNYLKKILPLYISALNYHPYYFYDNIHSHFYNFNGFPNLILTREYALICTSDYKRGILFRSPHVISLYWELFRSYQGKCSSMFHIVTSVFDECFAFEKISYGDSISYALQAEPCLTPYITEEILTNAVVPDLPDRDETIKFLWEYIKKGKNKFPNSNIYLYHTKKGISHFVRTGRLREIPENLYRPFTIEERCILLENWIRHCKDCHYHLLKKPLEDISENVHLCISDTDGYLLFTNTQRENIYLVIEEPGLLEAFLDYATSLDENDLYSAEETENYLRETLASLKKGILN